MDDDFTLKYEGEDEPAWAQPDFPPKDDLTALQTQAVCILATRFGRNRRKTVRSLLKYYADDWEGIWDNDGLVIVQKDIGYKTVRAEVMKRLLENAVESLDKENPFPTFEITGVLTNEAFIRRGYGTGFYIFQSIARAGVGVPTRWDEKGEQQGHDVITRYFSLVYLDVKSSKMIMQWLSEQQNELILPAVDPRRDAVWLDESLKKGKEGWKWRDLVQLGPYDGGWRHSVSFLGTSCADSPLKGTGIINWVTF